MLYLEEIFLPLKNASATFGGIMEYLRRIGEDLGRTGQGKPAGTLLTYLSLVRSIGGPL
jgi:hypothetical protein